MVKHTQTIRRQIADELFECVWPFCEVGASVNTMKSVTIFKYTRMHWHHINITYLEDPQIGMIGAVLEKLWLIKWLTNVSLTTTFKTMILNIVSF